jgi:hypothetical protein
MAETPFTVNIPDSELEQLKQRLELTRLPDELEDSGWDYGVPLKDMKRLVEYWKTKYDWRKHEAGLNATLPQFTRDIEVEGHGTLNIHYVHKKCDNANAIPLLFVHGCERRISFLLRRGGLLWWGFVGPGSFYEGSKIVPLLTDASKPGPHFHVVVFSLPGYGFSEGAKTKGFGLRQYAEVSIISREHVSWQRLTSCALRWDISLCLRWDTANMVNLLPFSLDYHH